MRSVTMTLVAMAGAVASFAALVGCAQLRSGPPQAPAPPVVSAPSAAVTPLPVAPPPPVATAPAPVTAPVPPAVVARPPASSAPRKAAATPAGKSAVPPEPVAGRRAAPAAAPPPPAVAQAPRPAAPSLDLTTLEQRLKDTKAIGVFTKLSLKNQVDDLLGRFRDFYSKKGAATLADLRQKYDLLLLKVLSVLQDGDPQLAAAISSSREAIWAILADPQKFGTL